MLSGILEAAETAELHPAMTQDSALAHDDG
jgi:hypothetical protein